MGDGDGWTYHGGVKLRHAGRSGRCEGSGLVWICSHKEGGGVKGSMVELSTGHLGRWG